MRNLKLLVCLAFLAGCSAAGKRPPMAEFSTDIDRPYPPLTLLAKEPSSELHAKCPDIKPETDKQCAIQTPRLGDLQQALRRTRLFEQVSVGASQQHDYTASVATGLWGTEPVSLTLSGLAFGLTAGLAPLRVSQTVEAEIDLKWRDRLLKAYRFRLPKVFSFSIRGGDSIAEQDRMVAEYLAAAFIREYQLDGAHTGDFLLNKLGASDYQADLAFPEQVLDYRHEERRIHPDPLLGAQLLYRHSLAKDFIDIYIYPVKGPNWKGAAEALSAEMELMRSEILAQAESLYPDLKLPEQAEAVQGPLGTMGLKLDLSFTGLDSEALGGEEVLAQIRLFLKKDKFLQFRKTGVRPNIRQDLDEFVAKALPQLDPPEESAYMAEMRLNFQRDAVFQNQWQDAAKP